MANSNGKATKIVFVVQALNLDSRGESFILLDYYKFIALRSRYFWDRIRSSLNVLKCPFLYCSLQIL